MTWLVLASEITEVEATRPAWPTWPTLLTEPVEAEPEGCCCCKFETFDAEPAEAEVANPVELIVVEAPAADDVSVIVDYLLPLLFFPVVELELLTVIVMANPPVAVVGDSLGIPDSVIVFYFLRGMSSNGPDHLRFD